MKELGWNAKASLKMKKTEEKIPVPRAINLFEEQRSGT